MVTIRIILVRYTGAYLIIKDKISGRLQSLRLDNFLLKCWSYSLSDLLLARDFSFSVFFVATSFLQSLFL